MSSSASGAAPAPARQFHLGYEPSFDGIRGWGILAVMAAHAGLQRTDGAVVAMDSFFVLSGFLITGLLVEEWQRYGTLSFRDFYMRRALRLFPALFIVLALWTPLASWAIPRMTWDNLRGAAAALFYSANWIRALVPGHSLGVFEHTWSLSVEEQFYALWPIMFYGLMRLRLRGKVLAGLLLTALVGIACYRAWLWHNGAPWYRLYNGLDTRADALLAGCAAALWVGFGQPERFRRAWPAIAGLATVVVLLVAARVNYESGALYTLCAPLVEVSCALVIISLVIAPSRAIKWALELKPVVWIGQMSYGLYLWHLPLFIVINTLPLRVRYRVLLDMVLGLACGTFSYYVIERPFLRMKKRFRADSRRRAAPPAQPAETLAAAAVTQ